jgi:mono/diheme cytochrome c family protein
MKNRISLKSAALVVFFVFIVTAVSSAQQKDDKGKLTGKALLDTKCSKCHGTDRPLGKKKTMEEWQSTVKRMQGKNPDWIKDEEAKQIVDYLFTVRGE